MLCMNMLQVGELLCATVFSWALFTLQPILNVKLDLYPVFIIIKALSFSPCMRDNLKELCKNGGGGQGL